jgi:hypothetical protein
MRNKNSVIGSLVAAAVAIGALWAHGQSLDGVFEVRQLRTFESGKLYHLIYPIEGKGITPGGLALDGAGQIYLSEVGLGANQGSIILLPKGGGSPLRIFTGLDRPSDIEILPDGTGLVISNPDGLVTRELFGISVKVNFGAQLQVQSPDVIIHTDRGRYRATVGADGYAHFPDMLGPGMNKSLIDVIIQNGSHTYTKVNQSLVSVNGKPAGHSVIEVTVP